MKNAPSILKLNDLIQCDWPRVDLGNGKWGMARPLGFYSIFHRIRCSWMVFIGKADVLIWISPEWKREPGQTKSESLFK